MPVQLKSSNDGADGETSSGEFVLGFKKAIAKYRAEVVEKDKSIGNGSSPLYMPCNSAECYTGCEQDVGMKCATGFSDVIEENFAGYCVDASVCGATYKGSAGTVVCNAINMVMTAVSALALLTQM